MCEPSHTLSIPAHPADVAVSGPLVLILIEHVSVVFIVVAGHIHGRKLQRINRNDFHLQPALIAHYGFAFFYFLIVHRDGVIAFGTNYSHDQSLRTFVR